MLCPTTRRLSGNTSSKHAGYSIKETRLARSYWTYYQNLGLSNFDAAWGRETIYFWLQILKELKQIKTMDLKYFSPKIIRIKIASDCLCVSCMIKNEKENHSKKKEKKKQPSHPAHAASTADPSLSACLFLFIWLIYVYCKIYNMRQVKGNPTKWYILSAKSLLSACRRFLSLDTYRVSSEDFD